MDGNLFTLYSTGFKVDDGGGEFVVIEGGETLTLSLRKATDFGRY